jgi:hypothetical protein
MNIQEWTELVHDSIQRKPVFVGKRYLVLRIQCDNYCTVLQGRESKKIET